MPGNSWGKRDLKSGKRYLKAETLRAEGTTIVGSYKTSSDTTP